MLYLQQLSVIELGTTFGNGIDFEDCFRVWHQQWMRPPTHINGGTSDHICICADFAGIKFKGKNLVWQIVCQVAHRIK